MPDQPSRRQFLGTGARGAVAAATASLTAHVPAASAQPASHPAGGLYEALSAEALRDAVRRRPVAWLPVGILEWHGLQSACGLDALKAETLCEMAAAALGGVCFPTLWLGPNPSTPFDPSRHPRGTLTIDQPLYEAVAGELLAAIEALGFKAAVLLSGHYPGAIAEIASRHNARGRMKAVVLSENMAVRDLPSGDHAATWETSVFMVLRPGLVDLTRLPALPPAVRHAGEVIPPPWPFLQQTEYYGVYGSDPRVWANQTFGRRGTEAVLQGLAAMVAEALGEPPPAAGLPPLTWPGDARVPDEVRAEFLLPEQWQERFEQMPVVYWPLANAGRGTAEAVRRCVRAAREHGGLVYPPLAYGPGSDAAVAISPQRWAEVVVQVVDRLAEMGFRVIVLSPDRQPAADLLSRLDRPWGPDGRSTVLVLPADRPMGEPVRAAVATRVPRGEQRRRLDDGWTINEALKPAALERSIYALASEARVYDRDVEFSEEEAAGRVLLDLGAVHTDCQVQVNDQPVGASQWPPYRFLLTGRVRPGTNRIRVMVRHAPQRGLDPFFYVPGPPRLAGPVTLCTWSA